MLPKLIFDTSVINGLEADGQGSDPLMRGLECGFQLILTGMNAGELIASADSERRQALIHRFRRLLGFAICISPPKDIIEALVSEHRKNPLGFDWTRVNVRALEYEYGISRRLINENICAQQKEQQHKQSKDFERWWKGLRPELDGVLETDPSKRPTSYKEAVAIATREGGVLWRLGQSLYGHAPGTELTEADIKTFMDACPPFRAVCHGLLMAWYNWSLPERGGSGGKRLRAGRNDLMMATYLPYCGRFISNDRAQIDNLRDIAIVAEIDCQVLSFDEFNNSLALVA